MDLSIIKALIDYGGMFVIAIGMFMWLVRVDIPKREHRFERQQAATLEAFALERKELLQAFNDDRRAILEKLESINVSIANSSHVCATNRSMNMVQHLMEKDSNLTFDAASSKVREYWRINGIQLP